MDKPNDWFLGKKVIEFDDRPRSEYKIVELISDPNGRPLFLITENNTMINVNRIVFIWGLPD